MNIALLAGAILATGMFLAGSVLLVVFARQLKDDAQQRREFTSSLMRIHYELLDLMAQASYPEITRMREAVKERERRANEPKPVPGPVDNSAA